VVDCTMMNLSSAAARRGLAAASKEAAQAKSKKRPSVHHPRHRNLPLEHKAAGDERPPASLCG
jgi:hypothetical protein